MRTTTDICPECGRPVPADSRTLGLCPRCLIRGVLGDEGGSGSRRASSGRLHTGGVSSGPGGRPAASRRTGSFVEPSVAELAMRLPSLRVIRLVGRGGMGAVYEAVQPALDRTVAVKVVPLDAIDADFIDREEAAERFKLEARALARLNHPNVVAVHDSGRVDALAYFVMEYVPGQSLRHAMARGPLPAAEALDVARQVCDALGYAHRRGVVHRDIKPENILLVRSDDGRLVAKVADFGLAKLTHADLVDPLTGLPVQPTWGDELRVPAPAWQTGGRAGAWDPAAGPSSGGGSGSRRLPPEGLLSAPAARMGTPAYAAPEQSAGRPVDARADLYALGVVLYEMLTGERPPPPSSVELTADDRSSVGGGPVPPSTRMPAPPPSRIAARLDDAVLRCLSADPADRFPSADDLRHALDAADPATGVGPPHASGALRRTTLLVGMAAAITLVVLPAAYSVGRNGWPPWSPPAPTQAVAVPSPTIRPAAEPAKSGWEVAARGGHVAAYVSSSDGEASASASTTSGGDARVSVSLGTPSTSVPDRRPGLSVTGTGPGVGTGPGLVPEPSVGTWPPPPASAPSTKPAGPVDVFELMATRYGRDKVLTVRVAGVPQEFRPFVTTEVGRAAGVPARELAAATDNPRVVIAAPSTDAPAVARALRLGRVTAVDPASNTVVVTADPALFPKSLGPRVDSPADPRFAEQAAIDLAGWDEQRRLAALDNLRRADPAKVPPDRRAAAVTVLRTLAVNSDSWQAKGAIEALGTWGSVDDVPLVERAMVSGDRFVGRTAIESLGKIGGPLAAAALVDRLGNLIDAAPASKALAAIGASAEPTLLARLADPKTEPPVRAGIVQHLGNAGSPACAAALKAAAGDSDGAIRKAAATALDALRRRHPNESI